MVNIQYSDIQLLVLPYSYYRPAFTKQPIVGVPILHPISFNLRPPKSGIVLWPRAVQGTAMPKATVQEDGHPSLREDNVDRSGRLLR
jgi:hypothetical protein